MPTSPLLISVNAVLLGCSIVLAVMLTYAGTQYGLNIGDIDRQRPLMFRIMRIIVLLIGLGLVATVLNLLWT